MTTEGLARLLSAISEEYGTQFSVERAAIWATALHDLSDDEGVRAYGLHIMRSKFPPHPSELRAFVRAVPQDAEALLLAEGEAAIRWMEGRLRDDGAVELGAVLNQIVRDFGGPTEIVREIREGEWRFRRAEAVRAYVYYRREGVAHVFPERPEETRDHEIEHAVFPARDITGLPSPQSPPLPPAIPQLPGSTDPEVAEQHLAVIRKALVKIGKPMPSTHQSDADEDPDRPLQ